MRFFSLDSSFHKYGTILFDLIMLNTLWLLTSMLSFGLLIPMANAGMFNSVYHTLIKEDGYMFSSFIYPFRQRLKTGLALTLIGFFLYALSAFNIWSIWSKLFNAPYLMPLYFVIAIEVSITMVFASALLVNTEMTIKQLLKYGFILSNRHMLVALACLIPSAAVIFASLFYNMALAFVLIAPVFWMMTWMLHKFVFSKYHLDKLL